MKFKSSYYFITCLVITILILAFFKTFLKKSSNYVNITKFIEENTIKKETELDLIQICITEKSFKKLKKKRCYNYL